MYKKYSEMQSNSFTTVKPAVKKEKYQQLKLKND